MKIKISDYIVNKLEEIGVTTIFGYQGGNISHLIDSIGNSGKIEFVETYHEQAAAFAANSYAQAGEKIGVAIASSGPGAINLLNGIANAFCDSIPCIYFIGDINTTAKKNSGSLRQNSFQEINILPMVEPIVKYATSIKKPEEIVTELEKAIHIATTGRKGPIVINLPHDIQRSFISVDGYGEIKSGEEIEKKECVVSVLKTVDVLKQSRRPVILIGGGMKDNECRILLKKLLDKFPVPVVCSLLGIDVLNHSSIFYRGVVGGYGNRVANLCIKYADCILILGNRIDDRQITSLNIEELGEKRIIHVDIDKNEIGNKLKEDISIVCDVHEFLKKLIPALPELSFKEWLCLTSKMKNDFKQIDGSFESEDTSVALMSSLHPNDFINDLSKEIEANYTLDVGNNQMHAMQSLYVNGETRVYSSGGLGAMGYSLPASIGTCYSDKRKKTICITGDGGLQMNIQELQTIIFHNLPVNIVLLNNHALGMIYDLQKKMFPDRYIGTIEGYSTPNFEKVSKAYGFKYFRVNCMSDYNEAINLLKRETEVFVELNMTIPVAMKPGPGNGIFAQNPQLNNEYIEQLEMEINRI